MTSSRLGIFVTLLGLCSASAFARDGGNVGNRPVIRYKCTLNTHEGIEVRPGIGSEEATVIPKNEIKSQVKISVGERFKPVPMNPADPTGAGIVVSLEPFKKGSAATPAMERLYASTQTLTAYFVNKLDLTEGARAGFFATDLDARISVLTARGAPIIAGQADAGDRFINIFCERL